MWGRWHNPLSFVKVTLIRILPEDASKQNPKEGSLLSQVIRNLMSPQQCSPWNSKVETSQFFSWDLVSVLFLCEHWRWMSYCVWNTFFFINFKIASLLNADDMSLLNGKLWKANVQWLVLWTVKMKQQLSERELCDCKLLARQPVRMSVLSGPSSTLKVGLWGRFGDSLIWIQRPPSKQAQMAN